MYDCLDHLKMGIYNNDEHALAQLYHLFHSRLIVFAKNVTHHADVAEEVVEDVFLKLWRNRKQILQVQNLPVYLFVSTRNTALNALSRQDKERTILYDDALDYVYDPTLPDPCEIMITNEHHTQMVQAIDNLPPRCKMIFKLVREDGLKYKEVAAILNISVNTIDAQMAIAVKKISQALQISRPCRVNMG